MVGCTMVYTLAWVSMSHGMDIGHRLRRDANVRSNAIVRRGRPEDSSPEVDTSLSLTIRVVFPFNVFVRKGQTTFCIRSWLLGGMEIDLANAALRDVGDVSITVLLTKGRWGAPDALPPQMTLRSSFATSIPRA